VDFAIKMYPTKIIIYTISNNVHVIILHYRQVFTFISVDTQDLHLQVWTHKIYIYKCGHTRFTFISVDTKDLHLQVWTHKIYIYKCGHTRFTFTSVDTQDLHL
jgi:hypothetical protein